MSRNGVASGPVNDTYWKKCDQHSKNKKTMKIKIAILGASVALVTSLVTSQAAFVTGNIGFVGGANLNTSSAGTATGVSSWVSTVAYGGDGSFSIIPDYTSATFAAPWSFSSGASPFWTVSAGGETFVFNLASSSITSRSGNSVTVNGLGYVTGTGTTTYDSTLMSWSFTTQDPSTTKGFTFSASTSSVPEPSTVVAGALLLLPFGVSTLRILRRSKLN